MYLKKEASRNIAYENTGICAKRNDSRLISNCNVFKHFYTCNNGEEQYVIHYSYEEACFFFLFSLSIFILGAEHHRKAVRYHYYIKL